MKRIGFIGLGTMGKPMATCLLNDGGFELTVYNRNVEKTEELRVKGARVVETPSEVARHCDVIFTMLTADSAVEEVLLGNDGVVEGATAGMIVIDCSTISPTTTKKVSQKLSEVGVEMLDAPVTGSEPQAKEGILTFMVGGKKEVYDVCIPLFNIMGQSSYYMGESGSGSYTKLANNTIAAINLLSLSEGIVLASKAGIDPEMFVKVVSGGGGSSGMMTTRAPKIINRDFRAFFSTELMHKDLKLASEITEDLKTPSFFLKLTSEFILTAINKGYGKEDICSVVKCFEEWANVKVEKLQ